MQGLNATPTTIVKFNGGTLDMTGNSMSVTQLVANSGRLQNVLGINNGATLNFSPTGIFFLAGSNTFNNPLNINGGTLCALSNNALGSGTTTVSGGFAAAVLAVSGGIALGEPIVLSGRAVNTAAEILSIGGSNMIAAPLIAAAGGTQYNIQSAAGLLTVSGSFQNVLSGAYVAGLNLLGSGNGLFSGAIADSPVTPNPSQTALFKSGSGTWTLAGVNTYSGTTTIDQGTLQLGTSAALPSGAGKGNVVFDKAANVAVLDINGNNAVANGLSQPVLSTTNLVVNNGAGTHALSVGGAGASSTFNGILMDTTGGAPSGSGTLALTKLGSGTLNIGGANTYSGATTIDQGTLQIGSSNALPAGSGKGNVVFDNAANAAVLDIDGNNIVVNGLSQPALSATNLVVNNGPGTATLFVGGAGASSTFDGVLANATNGAPSGSGTLALAKIGGGALTLGNSNTFSGGTTVSGGTLCVNGSLSSPTTVSPGAVLAGRGNVGAVTLSSGAALAGGQNNAGSLTVASLSFGGSANLYATLGGSNTSAAPIIVSGLVTTGSPSTVTLNVTGLAPPRPAPTTICNTARSPAADPPHSPCPRCPTTRWPTTQATSTSFTIP